MKDFLISRSKDILEVAVPRVEINGLLLIIIIDISVSEQLCVGREKLYKLNTNLAATLVFLILG